MCKTKSETEFRSTIDMRSTRKLPCALIPTRMLRTLETVARCKLYQILVCKCNSLYSTANNNQISRIVPNNYAYIWSHICYIMRRLSTVSNPTVIIGPKIYGKYIIWLISRLSITITFKCKY